MPHSAPSPVTLRLLACVESFTREEEGMVGHDDWPGLAGLLERELAVITRLADELGSAPAHDAATLARAEALRARYAALDERLSAARARAGNELSELDQTGRRLRAVRGAYAGPRENGHRGDHHAAA